MTTFIITCIVIAIYVIWLSYKGFVNSTSINERGLIMIGSIFTLAIFIMLAFVCVRDREKWHEILKPQFEKVEEPLYRKI